MILPSFSRVLAFQICFVSHLFDLVLRVIFRQFVIRFTQFYLVLPSFFSAF